MNKFCEGGGERERAEVHSGFRAEFVNQNHDINVKLCKT